VGAERGVEWFGLVVLCFLLILAIVIVIDYILIKINIS